MPEVFALEPYDPAWWNEFEDPVLAELVRASLLANLDVRVAVARLDQARSVFDETKLDRFPKVTVGASVDRREQVAPGFTDTPLDTTTYSAGFDAFWEIDLFGRVRSAVRAAAANAAELRRGARRRAGECGVRSGAQLLRAARPAAADRRHRAQPDECARDAAAEPRSGAMPGSARSRTSRARGPAWPASNRSCRRCARRWPSASIAWRC